MNQACAVVRGVVLLSLLAGTRVSAQPPKSPAPASSPAPGAASTSPSPSASSAAPVEMPVAVREALARALTRVAVVDLRVLDRPASSDYLIAQRLLQRAMELAPSDEDILRLTIDASTQAGRIDVANDLTRTLVKLNPDDTRAQLQMVSWRIAREQDAEGRLKLYEAFLGERGESIDPAVRSRLALDAALLLRERGDSDGFGRMLTRACELDSTNKDAATLAYGFYAAAGTGDALGRIELLANILKADPFDPQSHLMLAQELADSGAHSGAYRFWRDHEKIMDRLGKPIEPALVASRMTALWNAEGTDAVIKRLGEILDTPRKVMRSQREDALRLGRNVDRMPKAEEYRLPMEVDQLRAAVAETTGRTEFLQSVTEDLLASYNRLVTELEQPAKRTSGLTEPELAAERAFWRRELCWTLLGIGQRTELAQKLVEELRADPEMPPAAMERFDAWLKLRTGDTASAEQFFRSTAESEASSRAGLGIIAESSGKKVDAAQEYERVYRMSPGTILGAWARVRAQRLSGADHGATLAGAADAEALARGIPTWVEQVIESPRSGMSLSVVPATPGFDSLTPARLVIRIRNNTPVPLALGPDSPISSRLLVSPKYQQGGTVLLDESAPEVLKLDRRLRLMPRQELESTVWVEPGWSGWALQFAGAEQVRAVYRVLQGFLVSETRTPVPGPFSLATDTSVIFRAGVSNAGMPRGALVEAIANAQGAELLNTLAVARLRFVQSKEQGAVPLEDTQALCTALAERYRRADPRTRELMICSLPTANMCPLIRPFERAIREVPESDAGTMLLRLVVHAADPGSSLFELARKMNDPSLSAQADILQARLKGVSRCYARLNSAQRSAAMEPTK